MFEPVLTKLDNSLKDSVRSLRLNDSISEIIVNHCIERLRFRSVAPYLINFTESNGEALSRNLKACISLDVLQNLGAIHDASAISDIGHCLIDEFVYEFDRNIIGVLFGRTLPTTPPHHWKYYDINTITNDVKGDRKTLVFGPQWMKIVNDLQSATLFGSPGIIKYYGKIDGVDLIGDPMFPTNTLLEISRNDKSPTYSAEKLELFREISAQDFSLNLKFRLKDSYKFTNGTQCIRYYFDPLDPRNSI